MSSTSSALEAYSKGTRAWFADKEEGWVSAELVDRQASRSPPSGNLWAADLQRKFPTYRILLTRSSSSFKTQQARCVETTTP